ncbi:MAG: RagB/SusD family nutrient uptake outer membrane protein [Bacteroidales bacterium]|jgi:hypothetical protein|nr:RagB/SusD family nutrient uptake outer membrane protein [Bacteroidales bacterium]
MKKLILSLAVLGVLFTACKKDPEIVAVEGVTLSPATATVYIDKEVTLTPTIFPSNATDKSVTWTSSNTGVATVNTEGVVTGLSEGTTIITAKTTDGDFEASSIITVDLDPSICIDPDPAEVRHALNTAIRTLGNSLYLAGGNFHDAGHIMSLQLAGDLMTEDMVQTGFDWFYFDYEIDNNRMNYRRPSHTWRMMYAVIGQVNEAIELICPSTTNSDLQNILGQCLALRAFSYHILIQRFQQTYFGNEYQPGVPLILTSKDDDESDLSRNTVNKVYNRIEKDLIKAIDLLTAARQSKDYINKAVAQGFLARVYMCMHKFAQAEELAREARTAFPIMSATEAGGGYGYNSENNSEWMWGLKATLDNTMIYVSFQSHICSDGDGYAGLGSYKAIDNRLYNQMNTTDVRRNLHFMNVSIEVFFNTKFKSVPMWLMDNIYMRSSEMLLIEAEAQAQQGKNGQAATTLMELMSKRDPGYNKASATVDDIFLQKRLECWGEGVIFYDYRRLKKEVSRTYFTPFNNHLERLGLSGTDWKFIYQIPSFVPNENPLITEADQNPVEGDAWF